MPRAPTGTPSLRDSLAKEEKQERHSGTNYDGLNPLSIPPRGSMKDVADRQQSRERNEHLLGLAKDNPDNLADPSPQVEESKRRGLYRTVVHSQYDKIVDLKHNDSADAWRGKSSGLQNNGYGHSLRSSEGSLPLPIPYSTAASVLIPGMRPVKAALVARRRKLYKLWTVRTRESELSTPDLKNVLGMAYAARVEVAFVKRDFLDRVASQLGKQGVPALHDGVILDASPLPQVPIKALGFYTMFGERFDVDLDHQSKEDAEINGTPKRLPYRSSGWRRPFLIWLHGVVDTGNIGALARSALYFGADAMILSSRGTGSMAESGTQKSSAGASEFLQTLTVKDPSRFLKESQANGWTFISAVAPPSKHDEGKSDIQLLEEMTVSPVTKDPCVLILGNEDMGLPSSITKLTQACISIPGCSMAGTQAGLDSLNVSVAGALLLASFLRRGSAPWITKQMDSSKADPRSLEQESWPDDPVTQEIIATND